LASKTVQLKDFAKELGAYSNKQMSHFKKAVKVGVMQSIPNLVAASPVDTGLYASSWDMTVTESSVILGNYAPHAAIIEYGARPFTPPIGPLLAWAKRVLKDPSQPPEYSDQVWALARGTQKKIAREGMKPRGIMEKELPNIMMNIRKAYEQGDL